MKINKIAYSLLGLSFVLIMSGGFSLFVTSLRNDKQVTLNRMEEVNGIFEDFSATTSIFESYREDLYAEVLQGIVCDQLATNYTVVENKLSNYENIVDEIDKKVVKMDKLCDEVYYPDSSVNSKCSNYKNIYEQVVNYFVSDVSVYNKNVSQCNVDLQQAGIKLKEYKTKKKYIDYNEDKKYEGKEGA